MNKQAYRQGFIDACNYYGIDTNSLVKQGKFNKRLFNAHMDMVRNGALTDAVLGAGLGGLIGTLYGSASGFAKSKRGEGARSLARGAVRGGATGALIGAITLPTLSVGNAALRSLE